MQVSIRTAANCKEFRPASGRMRRLLALLAAGLVIAVSAFQPSQARDESLPSIVIDRESGAILSQNRAFDRWYPASLAKLMTVYVALRAKAAGEIADGSPVTISQYAASQPPSSLGVRAGGQLRLDAALAILVVKSANDIAVAVAESVAGTVPAFVKRMNAEAERLGLTQTRFANPNGLHSTEQYTSARDMALLARQLFREFPRDAHMFSVPAIRVGETVHHSYNLLLERFAGADGMKTGFVCASGYNIVASAARSDRQLIAVVAGAWSQGDRAISAARLLLDGFAAGKMGPPVEAAVPAKPPAPARSLRATMCSEKARKERYDPGPGDAVLQSPHLEARRITREPLEISLGGIDAPAADAAVAAKLQPRSRVPIPTRRPARPSDPA